MNDDHSELNDIILNRNEKVDTRKKMLISIGALAVIAIIIVIVMGRLSSSAPAQLPQPERLSEHAATPEPATHTSSENPAQTAAVEQKLDAVAQKVRTRPEQQPVPIEKSEVVIIDESTSASTQETAASSKPAAPVHSRVNEQIPPAKTTAMSKPSSSSATKASSGTIYIQVGSFSRYKPNQKFLDGIKQAGYDYTLHRVAASGKIVNKVLVGPFRDRNDARAHLSDIRRKIEPGAYIYTIKP
jgi:DedD protein